MKYTFDAIQERVLDERQRAAHARAHVALLEQHDTDNIAPAPQNILLHGEHVKIEAQTSDYRHDQDKACRW